MRIIKRTSDNVVIFAGKNLALDGQLISGAGWSYTAPPSWSLVLEEAVLPDGYVPSGWSYVDGVWTINEIGAAEIFPGKRKNKIESLTQSAILANYTDITHAGQTWKTDKESRDLLAQVLSVGSVPEGMYWRDAASTPHDVTYADLQALAYAILERGLLIDQNLITKTAAVNAATTAAAIDAVTW